MQVVESDEAMGEDKCLHCLVLNSPLVLAVWCGRVYIKLVHGICSILNSWHVFLRVLEDSYCSEYVSCSAVALNCTYPLCTKESNSC